MWLPSRTAGGSIERHGSSAKAQRGANTQPGGNGPRRRQKPWDRLQRPVAFAPPGRQAAQQARRVGMDGAAKHGLGRALLHQRAGVEHAHPVAHAADDIDVVADEQQRRALLPAQRRDQRQDVPPPRSHPARWSARPAPAAPGSWPGPSRSPRAAASRRRAHADRRPSPGRPGRCAPGPASRPPHAALPGHGCPAPRTPPASAARW